MKIAVLLSTYNGESYIKEQVYSILAQKGDFQIDILIRDDGSTDKTIEILQEYEKKGKLKWYSGNNIKSAGSFIELLHKYRGYDFYSFADQDDCWDNDKLSKGIKAIGMTCNPTLYFSNAYLVDENLKSLGRTVYESTPKIDFKTLSCAGGLLGCTMIFNKALAEMIQKKDIPRYIVMHDFYIALVCASVNGTIIYDKVPSLKYRQHSRNVIGIPVGRISVIKKRFFQVIHKKEVSIAEQASEIMSAYGPYMALEKKIWLEKIKNYRKNIITRLMLACSRETKYMNKNISLSVRLAILWGNR